MTQGLRDLAASERGVFCLGLLLAATILAALKVITGADWLTFAKFLALTLVASKTATGALETWTGNGPTSPPTASS